jgi:general secretion pathway protein I
MNYTPTLKAAPTLNAAPARPCSGRGPVGAIRAGGFTLIEIVAAFAILALGLAMAMQIAVTGLRQSSQAADFSEAALLAQTVLDTAGVGERLQIGTSRGEFENGFRWELDVNEFAAEANGIDLGIDPLTSPVRLLELELIVSWERGGSTREKRYRTLRAMLPEAL